MVFSNSSIPPISPFSSSFANRSHVIGTFDIVAEFWPHVAIILYRVYPINHNSLSKVFCFSCISTFAGTIIETTTVIWSFGSLWHCWTLPFKIVTPILHTIFSAAQLFGAKNFRSMWLQQRRLRNEQKRNPETAHGRSTKGHISSGSDTEGQKETHVQIPGYVPAPQLV